MNQTAKFWLYILLCTMENAWYEHENNKNEPKTPKTTGEKHSLSIRSLTCNCFDWICQWVVVAPLNFTYLSPFFVHCSPCLLTIWCYENDETSRKAFCCILCQLTFMFRLAKYVEVNKWYNTDSHWFELQQHILNMCVYDVYAWNGLSANWHQQTIVK